MASFVHLIDQRRLIGPGGSTTSGQIFFYYTGTTVKAPIYTDSALLTPAANPVVVGAGQIVPLIFLDDSIEYRRVIEYADGSEDQQDPLGNVFSEGELGLPVGAVIDYSGTAPPEGFVFCYGQELSRTTYAELFEVISTTYGPGNGTTTFNVPDYRGRVGAGKDNMGGSAASRLTSMVSGSILGQVGGLETHTLTSPQIPSHTHAVTDPGHAHQQRRDDTTGASASAGGNPDGSYGAQEYGLTSTATTGITLGNTGGGEAHNNVQPTIIVNKIIKTISTSFLSILGVDLTASAAIAVQAIEAAGEAQIALLQANTGSTLIGHKASGTNKANRTAAVKFDEWLSVPDFTTPALADASDSILTVPANVTTTVASGSSLTSVYIGPKQITTSDGNKRGRFFANADTAPATLGNHDSIETAFNGDSKHSLFPVEHWVTSSTALGTPSSGYLHTPEVYPHYTVSYVGVSSGHNQSTSGNDGRTGYAQWRGNLKHYGNGDAAVFNGSVLVAGNKAGATSVLAQPAGVIINGDMTAAADNVYLNSLEFYLRDNNYDIAAAGPVINLDRNNATGSQGAFWYGVRVQSKGSASVDAAYSATGKIKTGLDFAGGAVDFGSNKSAISLEANHRIYFNNASSNGFYTDVFNGDYITYSSGISGLNFVIGGSSRMQLNGSQLTVNGVKLLANGKVVFTGLSDFADDAAAAVGGITVGELYRTGNVLKIRIV